MHAARFLLMASPWQESTMRDVFVSFLEFVQQARAAHLEIASQ